MKNIIFYQTFSEHNLLPIMNATYEVCISQVSRFARVCSHVDDLNARNKCYFASRPIGQIFS